MKTLFFALLFTVGAMGLWAFSAISPAQAQSTAIPAASSQSATFAIENKTATVLFDPAVTDRAEIAAASTNAGYPAAAAGS